MVSQKQIPKKGTTHTITLPRMKTKITETSSHWSLISLNINELNSPIKKTQTNRLDTKTESILLLHIRNTLQPQRQTSPQSKGIEKNSNQMDLRNKLV